MVDRAKAGVSGSEEVLHVLLEEFWVVELPEDGQLEAKVLAEDMELLLSARCLPLVHDLDDGVVEVQLVHHAQLGNGADLVGILLRELEEV